MNSHTYACIAYIVGRIIAGKKISSVYDYAKLRHIDITSLPDFDYIKEIDDTKWRNTTGYFSNSRYQYSFINGKTFDIIIEGNTFIGHTSESSSYFIGNVRGDSIYIYDHEESAHINYRISGCTVERNNKSTVCNICWLTG